MGRGPEQTPLRRHTHGHQTRAKMCNFTSCQGNEIKTIIRHHLTAARTAIINKTSNNKRWRGCGEKEPSFPAGGNVN